MTTGAFTSRCDARLVSCHANKFPVRRIQESKVYAAWENPCKAAVRRDWAQGSRMRSKQRG